MARRSWKRIIRWPRAATMTPIAAGTGKKPKPFMRAKAFAADAVWTAARKADQRRARAKATRSQRMARPVKVHLPRFIEPQLCQSGGAAAGRRGLGA